MKRLFLLFTLLSLSISHAQFGQRGGDDARLTFGVYQDPSLALFEDDHGNKPFTTDVRFEFMMEGESKGSGSFLIGGTFEYADLSEYNFARYGLQLGYNFRNYELPFNLGYFDNALYGGAGQIMRDFPDSNSNYMSFEITNDFAIFLADWVSLNLKATLMQRGDLGEAYGDDSGSYRPWDWKFNGYIGFKFYLGLNIPKAAKKW